MNHIIYNYLDYIKIAFLNDFKLCYDIISEEKSEYINTVLKDYKEEIYMCIIAE